MAKLINNYSSGSEYLDVVIHAWLHEGCNEDRPDVFLDKLVSKLEGDIGDHVMSMADGLIEIGIERGIERGMKRGREEAKIEFALSALQQGVVEPEKVAKVFGLTIEELLHLKAKNQ